MYFVLKNDNLRTWKLASTQTKGFEIDEEWTRMTLNNVQGDTSNLSMDKWCYSDPVNELVS